MRRFQVFVLTALFFGGCLWLSANSHADDDPDDVASEDREDRDDSPFGEDRRPPPDLDRDDEDSFDAPRRRHRFRGDRRRRDRNPFEMEMDHRHHHKLREMFGRHINPDRNPKLFELVQKDMRLERATREMSREFRQIDSAEREELKEELMSLVHNHFEVRQQLRELRLKRMREELNRLEDAIERRNEARDEIISRRMAELTGDDDGLGF